MGDDRLPPLSALRAFEAAVRANSLSAAGRELNVTHAAIAQQVRRLEAHLGDSLLRRSGRGVAATPAGEVLAAGLGEGFERMRRAVAEAARMVESRRICIATTPNFAASWLVPRLPDFRRAHPDVELMIDPSTALIDLVEDGYDLALRYGDGEWPGLVSDLLLPTDFVVIAAPSLIAQYDIKTPKDLLGAPWLRELGADEIVDWLRGEGVDVADHPDSIHLPGYMAISAARAGQGVACAARVNVEPDLASGALTVLFSSRPGGAETGYHIVRPPGAMRPPLQRFVDWLKERAAEESAA